MKIKLFLSILFFLFVLVPQSHAQQAGTFSCKWANGFCDFDPANTSCGTGYNPRFSDGTFCPKFTDPTSCNNAGTNACTCNPGTNRCSANFESLEICATNGTFQSSEDCKAKCQQCVNGSCQVTIASQQACQGSPGCSTGQKRCSSNREYIEVCDTSGTWKPGENCKNQCKQCTDPQIACMFSAASQQSCTNPPVPQPPDPGPESDVPEIINLTEVIDSMGDGKFKFKSSTTLGQIVSVIYQIALPIGGILLLFVLIWGGFQYLTSAGDPKKTEEAKQILTFGIVGFFLIVIAYWLTQIVSTILNLGSVFG